MEVKLEQYEEIKRPIEYSKTAFPDKEEEFSEFWELQARAQPDPILLPHNFLTFSICARLPKLGEELFGIFLLIHFLRGMQKLRSFTNKTRNGQVN